MNEWGYFWNLTRPVLLEKSPPNMIISTFLQEVFSTGDTLPHVDNLRTTTHRESDSRSNSGRSSSGRGTTRAKFLFISRHPIANALALGKAMPGSLGNDGLPDMFEQVLHWLVSHETMRMDMERLEHAKVIR